MPSIAADRPARRLLQLLLLSLLSLAAGPLLGSADSGREPVAVGGAMQAGRPAAGAHPSRPLPRLGSRIEAGPARNLISNTVLQYHGGDIITPAVQVYLLYLGYARDSPTALYLNNLISAVQSTSYWAVMKRYYSKTAHVSGAMSLAGTAYLTLPPGSTLNLIDPTGYLGSNQVLQYIRQSMADGSVPVPNATDVTSSVYVLVAATASNVLVTKGGLGLCQQYCSWHSSAGSDSFKFILLPQVPAAGCGPCRSYHDSMTARGRASPSGVDVALDAMASELMHELAEAVTNPDLTLGWYSTPGTENADLCNTQYGPLSTGSFRDSATGRNFSANFNQVVGGRPYLLQKLWDITPLNNSNRQTGCVSGAT